MRHLQVELERISLVLLWARLSMRALVTDSLAMSAHIVNAYSNDGVMFYVRKDAPRPSFLSDMGARWHMARALMQLALLALVSHPKYFQMACYQNAQKQRKVLFRDLVIRE